MSLEPAKAPAPPAQTHDDLVNGDNWRTRRRVLFAGLLWISLQVSYLMVLGRDTAVNQQAVIALIGSGTAIFVAYIFGAVWDDHNKRMFFKNAPSPESH